MSSLKEQEGQFAAACRAAAVRAAEVCDDNKAILAALERTDALSLVRETLRRGDISPLFEELCAAGHPELTMEAVVTDSRFAALFTDREVNICLDRLCKVHYFG